MIQLYPNIINEYLESTYYKLTAIEKIKIINKKIEQNNAQINLDKKTAQILALPPGDVGEYEFLTEEDVLQTKTF